MTSTAASELERSLRELPESWLPFDRSRYLLLAGPIGGREAFFDASGALFAYAPLSEWAVKAALEKARAANASLEPVPAQTLALLTKGEAAYLELRDRLATGSVGWRIHPGLLVIELASGLYNTEFQGDVATSFTKLADAGALFLRAEQLKRATFGTAAATTHDVRPAQYQSLIEVVAKQDSTPELLLAAMERGELELVGGGPTSDQLWSLSFSSGVFTERSMGESRDCSREEVLGVLSRRGYHTVHWRQR